MMKHLLWMVWRLALAVLLLVVCLRSGFLAFYNWWAAGGPPTPDPTGYERAGNIFFAVASLCLASAVTLVVDVIRDRTRPRTSEFRDST
jgi:hypothetical protein